MMKVVAMLCAVGLVAAKDPVEGWLGYATGTNPSGQGVITKATAEWTVLDDPKEGGCFYSPWFGIETSDNLNLFQPVNPWVGSRWEMYIEYFQWKPTHNENSRNFVVKPGDVLSGVVTFNNASQTYTAVHTNKNTGQSITKTIDVQKTESGKHKEYTIMYIVFEKTCRSCAQYPPNNKVTFSNIVIEYDDKKVTPKWTTAYVDDKCDNRAHIVDPATVEITWRS